MTPIMMDAPPHFFNDYIDLEDSNPYPTPLDCEPRDDEEPFQFFGGRLGLNQSSFPSAEQFEDPKSLSRNSFGTSQTLMVDNLDQKTLFLDPDLYGELRHGSGTVGPGSREAVGSPFSTRRPSSSKSMSEATNESRSASTDITPPDRGLDRKKKTRKPRRDSMAVEDEDKRNKFLERNRIAASKCREKKKYFVSQLEGEKKKLENERAHLQMELSGLLGEISGLKHHLMVHAQCNDPNIDRWLANEARRFVQAPNELFSEPYHGFAPGATATHVAHGRTPSSASTYESFSTAGLADERRGSIAYCHASSSMHTSPTNSGFPGLASPRLKQEPGTNLDHMPDSMFAPDHTNLAAG